MCCTLLLSIVVASRYCGVLVAFACCVHTQSDHEAGREDRVTRGLGIDEIEIETVGLLSVDSGFFFSRRLPSVPYCALLHGGPAAARRQLTPSVGADFGRPAIRSAPRTARSGARAPHVSGRHMAGAMRARSTKFAI